MKYLVSVGSLPRIKADIAAVGIFEDGAPADFLVLDKSLEGSLSSSLKKEDFLPELGKTFEFRTQGYIKPLKVVVAGLGKKEDFSLDSCRRSASSVARKTRYAQKIATSLFGYELLGERAAQAYIEGWILGSYKFEKYKREKAETKQQELEIVMPRNSPVAQIREQIEKGEIIANSTIFARNLTNEPANLLLPSDLAEEAKKIAKKYGLGSKILDPSSEEMKSMGLLLGVGSGSRHPPKLIHLSYRPKNAKKHVALIGKGMTFDSGGLSLKSSEKMEGMKYDMAGAATVLATIKGAAELKLPVRISAIIPVAENMPGNDAMRPGDVLKASNDKTVEIVSTDAEGRLILADALCYACRQGVDEIIDVATLTGACAIALGKLSSGVMGNNDPMVEKLLEASSSAGEYMWRLPLYKEYKEQLKSEIADIKNMGDKEGGALTAALFLQEFVDRPWIHIDIAGTAWTEKQLDYCSKGATGVGVRTLLEYLRR